MINECIGSAFSRINAIVNRACIVYPSRIQSDFRSRKENLVSRIYLRNGLQLVNKLPTIPENRGSKEAWTREREREKGCALLYVITTSGHRTVARTVFQKYRMKYEDRGKRIELGFYYAWPRRGRVFHLSFEASSFRRIIFGRFYIFLLLFHVRETESRQRDATGSLSLDHCGFQYGILN